MNYGYQNEKDFVNFFNGKYLNDFDNNSREFLINVFDGNINNDEAIKAWKAKDNQKSDMYIKFKNYVKGISIKCGKDNSIHAESIQDFRIFLENLQIPYKVIDLYCGYHYGYKKDDNGNTNYNIRLSSEEYKALYQDKIDIFNKYINKTKIIIEMIDRFIIRGKNSGYDIAALISGTIDDYVWILKDDIYDLILSKRCLNYTSPHYACITIGPKKRNLDGKSTRDKDRYLVCGRWNFIRDDIINFKNNKYNNT